eukprot:scaffold385_cov305-Pinguiococcus_pyrenoidosus.AAC.10
MKLILPNLILPNLILPGLIVPNLVLLSLAFSSSVWSLLRRHPPLKAPLESRSTLACCRPPLSRQSHLHRDGEEHYIEQIREEALRIADGRAVNQHAREDSLVRIRVKPGATCAPLALLPPLLPQLVRKDLERRASPFPVCRCLAAESIKHHQSLFRKLGDIAAHSRPSATADIAATASWRIALLRTRLPQRFRQESSSTPRRVQAVSDHFSQILQTQWCITRQSREPCEIGRAKEADRARGSSVAAGPAAFLVVVLHRLGHAVVNHVSHIRLVDSHPEGDRRDDDADVPIAPQPVHQ